MKKLAVFLIAVLFAVAFADVGPAPPKPDVTVTFIEKGQPYAGIGSVVYHCIADAQAMENWGSEANFTCAGGVCRNDEWQFYKLSPCFYPENGYFTYSFGGKEMRSEGMGFNQSGSYSMEIVASTGELASRSWSSGACAPAAVLALAAAGLFISRKGAWN